MPNWCTTSIVFYSVDNFAQVKELYNCVNTIFNAPATVKNDFGKGWLGDYVNTLLFPMTNCSDVRCRGYITYIDEPDENFDAFSITTETAWAPMLEMWDLIVKKHYPSIKIAYLGEECGMEVYLKYDENGYYFPEEYDVEVNIAESKYGDYFHNSFSSREDVVLFLKEVFSELDKTIDIDSLLKENEDLNKLGLVLNAIVEQWNEENLIQIHHYDELADFAEL